MDLYMERVNGDAALAALRAAGHELPVVLCTANATSADAARYESLCFASLVGKPFSPDQMRAAIAVADINQSSSRRGRCVANFETPILRNTNTNTNTNTNILVTQVKPERTARGRICTVLT